MPTTEEARAYARGERPAPVYVQMRDVAATTGGRTDAACQAVFAQLTRRNPSVIR